MQAKKKYSAKTILLYGMGVTGRSAISFFQDLSADLLVYVDGELGERDLAYIKERQAFGKLSLLSHPSQIHWEKISFVLRSSGIRLEKELLVQAREHGVEVLSDMELAGRLFPGDRMLAITGSNGKTTTTSLLTHLLKSAGRKALAAGNIGRPVLSTLAAGEEDSYFVLEVSSFQLADVTTFAPHRAAILNITEDHLEWHHSYANYRDAKYRIGRFQKAGDKLWLNASSAFSKEAYAKGLFPGQVTFLDGQEESVLLDLVRKHLKHLLGQHNLENALFAAAMARDCGLSLEEIAQGLSSFYPIAHRMEYITRIDGVDYYNDSKATNVDSTVRALASLDAPVWLLAGGYDKKVSFAPLFQALKGRVLGLLLLGETAETIEKEARAYGLDLEIHQCGTLEKATAMAFQKARPGDVVLLSPASASWDQFHSFEERGDLFKQLVQGEKARREEEKSN